MIIKGRVLGLVLGFATILCGMTYDTPGYCQDPGCGGTPPNCSGSCPNGQCLPLRHGPNEGVQVCACARYRP